MTKDEAQELIKKHGADTDALHEKLRNGVAPEGAAKLQEALAKHKTAQQNLDDDAAAILWTG